MSVNSRMLKIDSSWLGLFTYKIPFFFSYLRDKTCLHEQTSFCWKKKFKNWIKQIKCKSPMHSSFYPLSSFFAVQNKRITHWTNYCFCLPKILFWGNIIIRLHQALIFLINKKDFEKWAGFHISSIYWFYISELWFV